MPDIGRALGAARRRARQPARPRAAARRAQAQRRARRPSSKRQPDRPDLLADAASRPRRPCRADRPAAARAGRIAAARCVARAAISPKAMTPRSTRCASASQRRPPRDRRAGSALPRGDRRRDAQDPPQCRARLSHRSRRPARRPADGAGFRLHPSPDAGRRGPLQFARPACRGEPGGRGRRACARRRGRAFRGTDRRLPSPRRRASPRPPTPSPGSMSPRATPRGRPRAAGACRT